MKRITLFVAMFLYTLNSLSAQEQETPSQVQNPTVLDETDTRYYADPFSPISQFDPAEIDEEEEVTERFYEYGRLIHLSVNISAVQPIGPMFDIYTMGWTIGTKFTYFLDWNFGFMFHANIGKTRMSFLNSDPVTAGLVEEFTGSATLFNMGFGVQYYPNLYDISKSLAWLNPSFTFGFEAFLINDTLSEEDLEALKNYNIQDPSHKATAPGLFFGLGVDIPILRKVVYLGLEFMYHFTFFPSTNYRINTTEPGAASFQNLDYSGRILTYGVNIIWNI